MDDYVSGFREIIPDQTLPIKWKDIILDTGCTQSTLQDIKATERAGGYSYKDSKKNITRNRFIYWRISQDTLELVELSLDLSIVDNHLRYKFTDTPLLDGLTIHETRNHVVILVATVSSVHRLSYPHPEKLHREGHHPALVPSIFSKATLLAARDPASFHIITRSNSTANSPLPNACTSWLSEHDEAVFTLACSTGAMLLVRMMGGSGQVQLKQLNEGTSIMPRLFANIAEALRGKQEIVTTVSMVMHNYNDDTFLFCLGSDANLRTWATLSTSKNMPVEVLLPNQDRSNMYPGFQPHMLRKCEGPDGQLYLAVYFCFSTEAKFLIFKPVLKDTGYFVFEQYSEVYAMEFLSQQWDLVDFCFSPDRLWAQWRTAEGETLVTNNRLLRRSAASEWQKAILEVLPTEPASLSNNSVDPKSAYIAELFHPGKFPLSVITRALSIYQCSAHLQNHVVFSPKVLKECVCQAVEENISKETKEFDTSDEEYLDISHNHWSNFYSCCRQYYLTGDKPGGIAILNNGGLLLVKKQRYSILRPMDVFEHFSLCHPSDCLPDYLKSHPLLSENPSDCTEMAKLLIMLKELGEQLPDEQMQAFDTSMHCWQSHDEVAAELAKELMKESQEILDPKFLQSLYLHASQIKDFYRVTGLLLSCLSLDTPTSSDEDELLLHSTQPICSLYAGQLGASVIALALQQVLKQRLFMCRCILLLEALLHEQLTPTSDFESTDNMMVSSPRQSDVLSFAVTLAHSYYAINWVCSRPSDNGLTIAELFIHRNSANILRALATKNIQQLSYWPNSMMMYIYVIANMMWPLNDNVVFPAFLYHTNQHSAFIGYEGLLSAWCDYNKYSRLFILGRTMLRLHQAPKACDYFIEASQGVTVEPYILEALNSDGVSTDRALAVYYLKVMQMFELLGYCQEVIVATESALAVIHHDEPELPTLHSLLFTHSMGLGRYEAAFKAMVDNPDEDRRKDCLREMVVTLVRAKKIDTLLQFPYMGLFVEVERILESRARAADMNHTIFYDVLYALEVRKGTMRKAASYMYEQAYRIENELSVSVQTLRKQKGCYLTCLNSLRLVDAKYRWLVRPKQMVTNKSRDDPQSPEPEVKLMEISDIKRELELVNARIKLIKERPGDAAQVTGKGWSAPELVGVLTNARLYTSALRLVKLFKLSPERPLEGLAAACVQIQQQPAADAWHWLANNDITEVNEGEVNAPNTAWKLLEHLLFKHEEPHLTTLHKVVLTRLLRDSFFPPRFLLASYKLRNPSELLRVYLNAGRLEECAGIAVEYLSAVMGCGPEYYGGSAKLLSGQASSLPWLTLDQLLNELDRPNYEKIHAELKNLIGRLFETAVRLSHQPAVGLVNS